MKEEDKLKIRIEKYKFDRQIRIEFILGILVVFFMGVSLVPSEIINFNVILIVISFMFLFILATFVFHDRKIANKMDSLYEELLK